MHEDLNKPIDLHLKTNLTILNSLWTILTGKRFSLTDERLSNILKSLESVLKDAKMASLVALLLPNLFKMFSTRFQRGRVIFEELKQIVQTSIQEHLVSLFKMC